MCHVNHCTVGRVGQRGRKGLMCGLMYSWHPVNVLLALSDHSKALLTELLN